MKSTILVAMAISSSMPALADKPVYEKNGLPCIAELCIGDGLEELRKVEWERAKPPFSTSREPVYAGAKPLTEYEKNDVNVNFRAGDGSGAVLGCWGI